MKESDGFHESSPLKRGESSLLNESLSLEKGKKIEKVKWILLGNERSFLWNQESNADRTRFQTRIWKIFR
ncbi:hypothetical protein CH380_13040 [Leptospira adleri]|uniref:Uncharacterized protein n=1 Tax=Leptospira adleri TaxID=2023186 RepID=A0A2M9YMD3_9LEPT|nr:hypothetical protein CH380_13040 [Leptospira adleri]